MLTATSARANCTDPAGSTVTCSDSVTQPQIFRTFGQSVLIKKDTRFITSGGDGAVFFASPGATFLNDGNISSDGDGVDFFSTNNSSFVNNGSIISSGPHAHAINLAEVENSKVVNMGELNTYAVGGNGIHLSAVYDSSVTNNGYITTLGAVADGINAEFSSGNQIKNNGNITVYGNGSNGISTGTNIKDITIQNLDNGVIYAPNGTGISVTNAAVINTLHNSGVIDGGEAGLYLGGAQAKTLVNTGTIIGSSNGSAVILADNSTVNQFSNQGIIAALAGDAIQISGNSTVASGINNEGIIIGRI